MDSSSRRPVEDTRFVSNVTVRFTKWTVVYSFCRTKFLPRFSCLSLQPRYPSGTSSSNCPGKPHRSGHHLPLYLRLWLRQNLPLHQRRHRRPSSDGCAHQSLHYTQPGVTRAIARSQVRSTVANVEREKRSNRDASAGLFQKDTLQQLRKLGLPTTLDTAHSFHFAAISTEYACATTNTQGGFAMGEEKEDIANTFKEAIRLPHVARWKTAPGKKIATMEKHGIYELVPIAAVPAEQGVAATRNEKLLNKFNRRFMNQVSRWRTWVTYRACSVLTLPTIAKKKRSPSTRNATRSMS